MTQISAEAIAAYLVILGGLIGVYTKLNADVQSLKEKSGTLKEQIKELKLQQKDKDDWIEGKIDLFMEKFEIMNTKINEFIHEFSKR